MKLPVTFAALVVVSAVTLAAPAQQIVQNPAQAAIFYQPCDAGCDPAAVMECWQNDPLPCRSRWFGSVDLSILAPHVTDHRSGTVNMGNFTDSVSLPGGGLDWTVSPTVGLGYRLNSGLALEATFQSVASGANFWLLNFDPNGPVPMWSRFHLNRLDLDVMGMYTPLTYPWEFRWRAGARLAAANFSTHAQGEVIEQRVSNHFAGAGPHVGIEAWRTLPVCGLFLFGKLDGAVMVGGSNQRFEESLVLNDGSTQTGVAHACNTAAPWTYRAEFGFCLAPPSVPWLRVTAAYQYEQWWGFGNGSSQTQLILQGPILRGEFNY
jgi:hypothetical protein